MFLLNRIQPKSPGAVLGLATLLVLALAGCDGCSDDPTPKTLVGFLAPVDGDALTEADDVNAQIPGVQLDVQLSVTGFSASGSISLQIGEDSQTLSTVSVDGDGTYVVESFTIDEGANALAATLLDSSGGLVATAGISITLDIDDVEEPTLSFFEPSADGFVLTASDDVDSDLSNGLQYDIVISSENVPVGTQVSLAVPGAAGSAATTLENGRASMPAVTLPETGPDTTIELTATATVAGQLISATRTVSVDTGACSVSISPADVSNSCEFTAETADASGEPGFQADITVTTDCSDVTLVVNGDETDGTAVAGQATFEVTLDQGRNVVRALASDSSGRSGVSADLDYTVDTEVPVLTIDEPDLDGPLLFTAAQDRDGDPSNGFQMDVAGSVSGVDEGTTVTVLVDGSDAGTAQTDGSGAFRLEDLTFDTSDDYTLQVTVEDDCENGTSTDEVDIEVIVEELALAITSPANETTLLADDDLDEADGLQTDFELSAVALDPTTSIRVECRRRLSPLYSEVGAADRGTDDPVVIRVTLAEGELFCRAFATQDDRAIPSVEVELFVDTGAPDVEITEPDDDSFTNVETTDLAAFVRNLGSGGAAQYQLNDDDPVDLEVIDEGAFVAGLVLSEGENTLAVTATDTSGNTGSDSVGLTYDVTAPTIAFVDPSPDDPALNGTDLHGDETFGEYLYDVVVSMDEAPLDDVLCLTPNLLVERCAQATEDGGVWQATFVDTFVLPGDNALDAAGLDLAGNDASAHLDLTVNSALPRLEITELTLESSGAVIAPVDGSFIPGEVGAGAEVDLVVETTGVTDGQFVQIVIAGVPGRQGTPSEDGTVTFEGITLEEGASEILTWITDGLDRQVGFSATVTVTVDSTAPEIAFTTLVDETLITLANSADSAPRLGYQFVVDATASGVEDGQIATLTLSACSVASFDGDYESEVLTEEASFEIDVPEEGSCTLTLNVSDRTGNPANATSIDLEFDVLPPEIIWQAPTDSSFLGSSDDRLPGTDGMQFPITLLVNGASGSVTLVDGDATLDLSQVVSSPAQQITFDNATIPDGEVTLTATAVDQAGNETVSSITITVSSDQVEINFAIQDGIALIIGDDVSEEDGFQGNFFVQTTAAFPGETVLFCLKQGEAELPDTRCSDARFQDISETQLQQLSGNFADVGLPEGPQVIAAELILGGTRVTSTPITVTVDTVPPEVSAWVIENDLGNDGAGGDGAGDAILNYIESNASAGPPEADITIQFSGLDGITSVSVYEDTTLLGQGNSSETESFRFQTPLAAGSHTLRVTAKDNHGNGLPPETQTLELAVDVAAPTVVWQQPTNGADLLVADDQSDDAGAQVNARLLVTGVAEGTVVSIDGTDPASSLTVDGSSIAAGVMSVPEDTGRTLTANAFDVAFNLGSAAISVDVDVTGPEVSITPPDDIDSETPGLQVGDVDGNPNNGIQADLVVVSTHAESGQPIQILSSFFEGGAKREIATGTVGTTSGDDLAASSTIRVTLSSGPQFIVANATDTSGNVGKTSELRLEVPIDGCGLRFTLPTASPVLLTTTTQDFEFVVLNVGECADQGDPAEVSLRIGCGELDDDACQLACEGTPRSPCVIKQPVDATGSALFEAIPFVEGETVAVSGLTEHPSSGVFSSTEDKTVIVDTIAPVVSIDSPLSGTVLSIASGDDPEWDVNEGGGTITGSVELDISDTDSTTELTVTYNGIVLIDDVGAIEDRPVTADDPDYLLEGVVFPSTDEALAAELVVTIVDRVGNSDSDAAALNVDVDAPPAPALTVTPVGGDSPRQFGQTLSWLSSTDDSSGGGPPIDYDWVAAEAGIDLDDAANWDALNVTTVATGETLTGTRESLLIEQTWQLAVRATDEVGNIGPPSVESVSTSVRRLLLDNLSPRVNAMAYIGDVNGDEIDDVALAQDANDSVLVFLGDSAPGSITPITIDTSVANTLFGAGIIPAGDLNADGLHDFAVVNGCIAYIYFGDPSATALAEVDVTITGPGGTACAIGASVPFVTATSEGWGDFIDTPAGDCVPFDEDTVLGGGEHWCHDDLRLSTMDILNSGHGDTFVIEGRDTDDWLSAYTIEEPVDATAIGNNCDDNIVSILGANGTSTDVIRLGVSGGMADLDGDGWAEVIIGTQYENPVGAFIHVLYGGELASCPATGQDLGSPTGRYEVLDASIDCSATGCVTRHAVPLSLRPALFDGGSEPVAGGMVIVATRREDRAYLFTYDLEDEAFELEQTTDWAGDPGVVEFGRVAFMVGDFDQDPDGREDLVVTGIGSNNGSGTANLLIDTGADACVEDGEQRFSCDVGAESTLPIIAPEPAVRKIQFGNQGIGGFDLNDDGAPDFLIGETTSHDVFLYY